jgi:glycosyltransferase involved in cell wall biosynthesis
MNIFYIPSWYPNPNDPVYGIFIKEEIELLARHYPDLNIAVSTWGQGDEDYLLWVGKPFSSIGKLLRKKKTNFPVLEQNHYFAPAFSWTRKFLNGNRAGIVDANRKNLQKAISDFGTIDLIHVYASYPGAIVADQLSKEYKIPYIITSHMSPFPFEEFLKFDGSMVDWLAKPIRNASAIIATSQSAKRDIEKYGFEVTEVIPIARDLDLFTIDPSVPKNEVFTFLAVGRLVPQKGFDLLLQAFANLEGKFRLRIVGDGEDRNKLEKMIRDLGLVEAVTLTGAMDRKGVIKEMQSCDVYVLSSRHETFGNVVVEAAACGKPVIATKCGGPEDIVTDDVGILIEKDSVEALIQAMSSAIQLKENLKDSEIRMSVVKNFDSGNVTRDIVHIYDKVLLNELVDDS